MDFLDEQVYVCWHICEIKIVNMLPPPPFPPPKWQESTEMFQGQEVQVPHKKKGK